MINLSVILCSIAIVHPRLNTNRAASINSYGVGLVCALAQLQRSQQAEGGVQLRDVSGKVHGQEYSGFYLGVQQRQKF
jgi:hypothetical protein